MSKLRNDNIRMWRYNDQIAVSFNRAGVTMYLEHGAAAYLGAMLQDLAHDIAERDFQQSDVGTWNIGVDADGMATLEKE